MWPDAAHVIGAKATFAGEACPLLEIASLSATSTATVDALTAVGDRLGAMVVVSRAPRRFISDRLLAHFYHAADRVLIEGSTPWEVDEALVAFGYVCGPYEGQDILGVDRAYASLMREDVPLWRALPAVPILGRMLELGKLGRKTGAGWYRYPGGAGKVDDPIVADLALEEAYFAGLARQDFTEAEIVERIVLSQINAAARILSDMARPSATAMNAVSIHGVGFPADLGGVLCHADRIGVAVVVDALDRLAAGGDAFWAPCPLLRDCAGRGIGLSASM